MDCLRVREPERGTGVLLILTLRCLLWCVNQSELAGASLSHLADGSMDQYPPRTSQSIIGLNPCADAEAYNPICLGSNRRLASAIRSVSTCLQVLDQVLKYWIRYCIAFFQDHDAVEPEG